MVRAGILRLLLLLSASTLLLACGRNEDYKVYSDLLSNEILTHDAQQRYASMVIINCTRRHDQWAPYIYDDIHDKKASIKQAFPDLASETVDNYFVNNEKPVLLNNSFSIPIKAFLIGNTEAEQYFNASPFMKGFYDKYVKATGITRLSRVGYDPTRKEGLVYIDHWSNPNAGGGGLIQIKKANGHWCLYKVGLTWIS